MVGGVVLGVVGAFLLGMLARPQKVVLPLGINSGEVNQFHTTNQAVVTTSNSGLPARVLAENTSRYYAAIVNDSDTAIYITLQSFTNSSSASTTVGAGKGIRLNSNGGSYEILPENMYTGEVWASSSASGKSITSVDF